MAVYWVTECIPLPVTALLPIVLLPLLSIMDTNDVCITYFKESNMMFIGKHKHDNFLEAFAFAKICPIIIKLKNIYIQRNQ